MSTTDRRSHATLTAQPLPIQTTATRTTPRRTNDDAARSAPNPPRAPSLDCRSPPGRHRQPDHEGRTTVSEVYDVAVVGAGAMGSAAAWALSKSGRSVVALEQFPLGHDKGGSHGATRIFRMGSEQSHYVDLVERARALWAQLESETGSTLLTTIGALEHGMSPSSTAEFSQFLTAQGVDNEVLAAEAAAERWSGMVFSGPVLYQAGSGILHADRVVSGLQRVAAAHGAEFRPETRVQQILVSEGSPVVVETDGGEVRADRVIVTVGSWAEKLLAGLVALPSIRVTQEQPRLFAARDSSVSIDEWPCFVHWRGGDGEFDSFEGYGLYEAGAGYKVGLHRSGRDIDPDARDFAPEPRRDAALHDYLRQWFPGLDPERSTPISCIYDNSPRGDFVIDRFGPVSVATGFSGEGFKFVPVVGELLRDLALGVEEPREFFTAAHHLR